MNGCLCTIYRSRRMPEAYLYVAETEGLKRVPEALLSRFGEPELAMTLMLNEERKLARANAAQVLADIEAQGFYLQMPPSPFARPPVVENT